MRKVYYNLMRIRFLPLLAVSFFFAAIASRMQQPRATPQPRPPQSTLKAASLESHEGLTISALPGLIPRIQRKFPKKSPYTAGVLAVQVVFRNDSNESLRVNLDRIRLTVLLEEENRQEVQPLTSQQLADAVLRPIAKDPTKRKRLPIPTTGGSGNGCDKHWTEVQKQAQDAEIPSSVVAAHGTVQGLLYFDMQNQFDLLQSAHLYIPQISQMDGSRALTYFDIDLSRRGPQ